MKKDTTSKTRNHFQRRCEGLPARLYHVVPFVNMERSSSGTSTSSNMVVRVEDAKRGLKLQRKLSERCGIDFSMLEGWLLSTA